MKGVLHKIEDDLRDMDAWIAAEVESLTPWLEVWPCSPR